MVSFHFYFYSILWYLPWSKLCKLTARWEVKIYPAVESQQQNGIHFIELFSTTFRHETCHYAGVDFSCFIGDLAPDVTDYVLQEHFRAQYPSVRSAKVRQRV